MAGSLSLAIALLFAFTCQAYPQIVAADVKDAAVDDGAKTATINDQGGNVIACTSQIAWEILSTTYLDCVDSGSTISTGSASAAGITLITTTDAKGATITELPIQFDGKSTLDTLISPSGTLLEAPPTVTTKTIETVNDQGSTISELVVVDGSTTSIVSTVTGQQIPTKSFQTITTTNVQGSTVTEVIAVSGSSTSVISTLGGPTGGTTETVTTTDAQGSAISKVVVATGSSTKVVSTLGGPTGGTTKTVDTTNAQGSTISEVVMVVGLSTKIVSTLPTGGQATLGTITDGTTSTVKTMNAQGKSTMYIVVIDSSATETLSAVTGETTDAVTSPTSTETVLPPGASIETLSSGAYTVDQWITTTKPGSSSGTVIPIIIPTGLGLPPIAIWGVVPGPPPGGDFPSPPAWEINIPGIPCFEIFGIKFGDCPPGTDPSGKGTGTNTGPSATSGSGSCTASTAIITTSSCVTSGTLSSCTILTTPTVGCSATGSVVTTGSCVAMTTLSGTSKCCSSATISAGSTVCQFASMTEIDMYVAAPNQAPLPAGQMWSSFQAYTATMSGSISGSKTGTTTATGTAFGPTALCTPTSGPDVTGDICICSTGTIIQTISSFLNPTSGQCAYTALPSPTKQPTSSPAITTTATGKYILTVTDINNSQVIECTSVSVQGVDGQFITECAGGITTIKTANAGPSVATSVTNTTTNTGSITPVNSLTAEVLITFMATDTDGLELYQYRAFDGTPGKTIDACGSTPISFYTIDDSKGDASILPTDQLPKFKTDGTSGCTYSSTSDKSAGSVNCPGWASPVQCTTLQASDSTVWTSQTEILLFATLLRSKLLPWDFAL